MDSGAQNASTYPICWLCTYAAHELWCICSLQMVSTEKLLSCGNCLGSWHCSKLDCLRVQCDINRRLKQKENAAQNSCDFSTCLLCFCDFQAVKCVLLVFYQETTVSFSFFGNQFAWILAIKLLMRPYRNVLLLFFLRIFVPCWKFADAKVWTNMLTKCIRKRGERVEAAKLSGIAPNIVQMDNYANHNFFRCDSFRMR